MLRLTFSVLLSGEHGIQCTCILGINSNVNN